MSTSSHTILRVRQRTPESGGAVSRFNDSFSIGRDPEVADCALDSEVVSRLHIRCKPSGSSWILEDNGSTNGTFIRGFDDDDQAISIDHHKFEESAIVVVGDGGPELELYVESPGRPHSSVESSVSIPSSATEFVGRFLTEDADVGQRRVVEAAFSRIHKKKLRPYRYIVAGVTLAAAVLAGGFVYKHHQFQELNQAFVQIEGSLDDVKKTASDLFYEIRGVASTVGKDPDARNRVARMEAQYDAFLDQLGVNSSSVSDQDRAILKMARVFGESELDMPGDFVEEVKRYIDKWKTTKKLAISIKRAKDNNYIPVIREKMLEHYLPPQFFYLGLQESAYDNERAIGPTTRWGIAKGVWQFIPDTGRRYGLEIGPLQEERQFDPRDDRFDFPKATDAAARYLADIYSTEAKASGLLVVASYNWGEGRIRKRLRELPDTAKDRNFWNLLRHYKIPKETRDYVLRIFSAAVIGENPRLFGFDFENPLKS